MLKILTPEQIKSLTPEQLAAIYSMKKDKIPELKALVLSLSSCVNHYNFGAHRRENEAQEEYERHQIETKILSILHEYSKDTFYLICAHYVKPESNDKIHVSTTIMNKYTHRDRDIPRTYKIFTRSEIVELVPENMIDKLQIQNGVKLDLAPSAYGLGTGSGICDVAKHIQELIEKVPNLHVLSPHLLHMYSYFQSNSTAIDKFIKEL